MFSHIGESENDTVFGRSFSALYMSILAAQDLPKPFLSAAAFRETLDTALQCYAGEKDLRGYVPVTGWAHTTGHIADLLKFLARNPHLSAEDQKRIVNGVLQRCRTAHLVFTRGEDTRMAAALLSVIGRKDFNASPFETWFQALITENKELLKSPAIDVGRTRACGCRQMCWPSSWRRARRRRTMVRRQVSVTPYKRRSVELIDWLLAFTQPSRACVCVVVGAEVVALLCP